MRKDETRKPIWRSADGWYVAHVVGHSVTIRQVDEQTLDVSIDGHGRRWRACGEHPLQEAEQAVVAMLQGPRPHRAH
jgi:hypothetical protein